ncbi:MAG: glycosyltransferase family 25 protein [Methyloglobulus sp.]
MKKLLTDIFDAVYIINLPERLDRRTEMELELKKVNLSYQNKQVVVFPAIKVDEKGKFPSIGSRGCFLSHLSILRQARDSKARSILFMEDDLAISPKLQSLIPSLANALESKDWSILYLGHVENTPSDSAFELLTYSKPVVTAHFYAVKGDIIDRLITFLETVMERPGGHPDGGPMHYDGALSTFRQQNPNLITLLASPNLGWQRSSRSDIAATKWFDKIPVFRSLVAQARKIRNWAKK